jgi:hypothetical protein
MNKALVTLALILATWVTIQPHLPDLEGYFFPVVEDTKIEVVEPDPEALNWSLIEGSSLKVRDCQFLGIKWYLGHPTFGTQTGFRLLERSKRREPGRFSFGVWAVQLTPEQLTQNSMAVATHRCHPFWITRTVFYPIREEDRAASALFNNDL